MSDVLELQAFHHITLPPLCYVFTGNYNRLPASDCSFSALLPEPLIGLPFGGVGESNVQCSICTSYVKYTGCFQRVIPWVLSMCCDSCLQILLQLPIYVSINMKVTCSTYSVNNFMVYEICDSE